MRPCPLSSPRVLHMPPTMNNRPSIPTSCSCSFPSPPPPHTRTHTQLHTQHVTPARVGWCTSKADMQRSIGADEHGYAFRDVNGAKVHNGKRDHYGAAFGASWAQARRWRVVDAECGCWWLCGTALPLSRTHTRATLSCSPCAPRVCWPSSSLQVQAASLGVCCPFPSPDGPKGLGSEQLQHPPKPLPAQCWPVLE
jgi:hypothetical protein